MRRIPTKSGSRQGEPVDQTMWTLPCDGVLFFFCHWWWCAVGTLGLVPGRAAPIHLGVWRGEIHTPRRGLLRQPSHRSPRPSVGRLFVRLGSSLGRRRIDRPPATGRRLACIFCYLHWSSSFHMASQHFFPTRNVRSGSSCCLPPPAGGSIRFRALALLACKRVPDEKSSDGSC
jgi:hypothetical protein